MGDLLNKSYPSYYLFVSFFCICFLWVRTQGNSRWIDSHSLVVFFFPFNFRKRNSKANNFVYKLEGPILYSRVVSFEPTSVLTYKAPSTTTPFCEASPRAPPNAKAELQVSEESNVKVLVLFENVM